MIGAEGGQAHEHDGGEEGVFAPDHVPQPAEHQGAERPDNEAGGECHQGEDERRGVIDPGEELLADDRRKGAVEEKVIPLEDRPERRGEDDFLGLLAGARAAHGVQGLNVF
jgi:hypothetical protein